MKAILGRHELIYVACVSDFLILAGGSLMTVVEPETVSNIASTGEVVRFAVSPPDAKVFSGQWGATVPVPQFALSPDGRKFASAHLLTHLEQTTDADLRATWSLPVELKRCIDEKDTLSSTAGEAQAR